MKIYDTEKEARDAAEKKVLGLHNSQCGYAVKMTETSENITVKYTREEWDGWTSKVFRFKPERVAPAQGQAVMNTDTGEVAYSMGTFGNNNGGLYVSRYSHCERWVDRWENYTPVDVTPAGQFAKAVELLEIWLVTYSGGNDWTRDTVALLDEIKAGGE
jgi:hypothetical protein